MPHAYYLRGAHKAKVLNWEGANVDALRAEVATASTQFRNADMVEAGEDLVYDMAGNWGKTAYGHLVSGSIGSINQHAKTY